jgi:hypothetical protein
MKRLWMAAGAAALLGGCFSSPCDPEPDITVTLSPLSEDVRTLPVLASGGTTLLGTAVPDAHGDIRV